MLRVYFLTCCRFIPQEDGETRRRHSSYAEASGSRNQNFPSLLLTPHARRENPPEGAPLIEALHSVQLHTNEFR